MRSMEIRGDQGDPRRSKEIQGDQRRSKEIQGDQGDQGDQRRSKEIQGDHTRSSSCSANLCLALGTSLPSEWLLSMALTLFSSFVSCFLELLGVARGLARGTYERRVKVKSESSGGNRPSWAVWASPRTLTRMIIIPRTTRITIPVTTMGSLGLGSICCSSSLVVSPSSSIFLTWHKRVGQWKI